MLPGVLELAAERKMMVAGDDLKTGQAKLKSVIMDNLLRAGLKPKPDSRRHKTECHSHFRSPSFWPFSTDLGFSIPEGASVPHLLPRWSRRSFFLFEGEACDENPKSFNLYFKMIRQIDDLCK